MKTHLLENIVADKDSFIPNPPTPANRVQSLNHFKVERDHEDIAWITFDMQGSAANV
jgi:3-hydroxyacyl-CoA dehydrogenase/enoyl-CoA hydratase/3-hydroxybutyryl-CoA epimerase